jgi:DNA-binding response OmpR family regulator/nitrogen-specific signal transduction histidine kinase
VEAEDKGREAQRLKGVAEEMLAVTREQAEQLRELDEAKSRFFANVSHEFRTPLTLTIGPLEDLSEGRHGRLPPEADAQVDMALRSSRRLLKLVNQILDLTRLEAGQRRLRARRGDLSDYLVQLAQAFTSLAQRRQVSLQVKPLPSPVPVWFDPDLIEDLFLNLLGNAFKFTPEGGVIQVSMLVEEKPETDGFFVVTVRDNGPGIPPDELPRMFERFHRIEAHERAAPAGTGIGLSLAREVTQLHGGSISVESEFGFGAAFTVRLPLGTAHLSESERILDAPAPAPSDRVTVQALEDSLADSSGTVDEPEESDRTTILVVDDNPDVRAFLRSQLEDTYRLVEAVDGQKGLAAARAVMPDLVLSDVMMPEMDGYALCRALKKDPELNYIPVILLTARTSDESRVQGLELGADDYLTKPFNRRELLARIRNLIASRRKLRAAPPPELRPSPLPDGVISSDQAFLDRVRAIIEDNFENEEFSVQILAREVGLDRSQLFRRLRSLLGLTPTDVIRNVRLERAALLLEKGAGSVSEIGYSVGFKSVSHFSASFRQKFGMTPSAWALREKSDGESPGTTQQRN